MSSEAAWAETSLGECAIWFSGGTPRTSEPTYWGGEVPWISSGSLTSFYITNSERRVTQAGVANGTRLVPAGTVIFVVRGMSLKTQFRIGIAKRPVTFGQDCKALIAKPEILPEFLANVLRSRSHEILAMVEEAGHGTGTLQTGPMKALRVPLPPLDEQRRILKLVTVFDDLISVTQQTTANLEAIAQAIFKSWFVDFDPVRARAEGREPEGMNAETAALFPSEFDESELGPIPRRWNAAPLKMLCASMANGGTPSRKDQECWSNPEIPWFKTGELEDGFLLDAEESISSVALHKSSVKVFPRHTVLIALYGATIGRLGILTGPATFNQACTAMVANPEVGPWFLFLLLRNNAETFVGLGNGAAQQNISKAIVESFQCVYPPLPVLAAFNSVIGAIMQRVETNTRHVHTLAQLRDELLPRLISGKLRVPEAQRELEVVSA